MNTLILELKLHDFHLLLASIPFGLYVAAFFGALGWLVHGNAFWRRMLAFLSILMTVVLLVVYFSAPGKVATTLSPAMGGLHLQLLGWHVIVSFVTLLFLAGVSFWLERRTTIERVRQEPIAPRIILFFLITGGAVLYLVTAIALSTGLSR